MRPFYIFIVFFLLFQNIFCQEINEEQKYVYNTKSLYIVAETNRYNINESDTINLSIHFKNTSADTSYICLFKKIEKLHEYSLTLAVYFSNFSTSNEDYLDTLLLIEPDKKITFNFKIPVNYFFQFKNEYGEIRSVLDLGYFTTIEPIKELKYSEGKLYYQDSKLILPHLIIENTAQRLTLVMFSFLFK